MNEHIIYEQPVTENVRNFLKCEYLFEKFNSALQQHDIWSVKSSVSTLIEISDFIFRINLKVELLKELEKNILFLNYLYENNSIHISMHDEYITKTKNCVEVLNNIIESPAYLNFLSSNKSFIIDSINQWYLPFKPFFSSSKLLLDTKRINSEFVALRSSSSYFEKKFNKSSKFDLVRIKMKKNINIYPDISVSTKNINIIFKTSFGQNRLSKAISENIDFELSLSCFK